MWCFKSLSFVNGHIDSMTMRIACVRANRSLRRLVGTLDKQRVRVAAGLIDNLQQATVPKQAAVAGATFVEKGKRGNWSLHQGHRRGAGAYQQLLTATCKRNGVCGSPP